MRQLQVLRLFGLRLPLLDELPRPFIPVSHLQTRRCPRYAIRVVLAVIQRLN